MADDKTPEEVLIEIDKENPDFYEEHVIKPTIRTLYGGELAIQLVFSRIPFHVTYEIEHQTTFHIEHHNAEYAYEMMSMIRRTKLR